MEKYNATYIELLMKLYSSERPVHCSYLAEDSLTTGKNLLAYAHFLIEKGLVEKVKIFHTDRDSPCFRISEKGKIFVEKILDNFPLIGD
ncbi:MAG: hypothetical protein M1416_00790 [Candidatus Pacearchaeota archaeon]|nr:hypothetical protein [Candidatus Pacearchaeota archaeon]